VKAQQLILSGNLFPAAEMASLGIVDVLVDAGGGESAVHEYIARNRARHRACAAFSRARRCVDPVTIDELRDVTDIWVDAAFRLSEHDLRKMIKIATAQNQYR
jgi:DSF synthase